MSKRLAILCPGQGGQHPQMFDLARSDPQVATLLDDWPLAAVLGGELEKTLNHEIDLFRNRFAQPLVVAATLATWAALKAFLPRPTIVAGYSIGEVAAHAVAGSISSSDAIRIAAMRAAHMDACVQPGASQALLAVSGLRLPMFGHLLPVHRLFVAIETGEDRFILGGLDAAITAIAPLLHHLGGHTTRLPVGVASHTPLMDVAAADMLTALRGYGFVDPLVSVLSGINGQKIQQKEQVPAALSRQVAETVRWMDCMDACHEEGIGIALELGPGAALAGMLKARHPHIDCRSVSEFRSLAGVVHWLERHLQ